MIVLKVFEAGQPALLYIVPALFVSVFGTAVYRGEFKDVWSYSEHIEEYKGEDQDDESDEEYVHDSDDSYDEWEDHVEQQRSFVEDELDTDTDDLDLLVSDLTKEPTVLYEFARSDDEDDDTFIIDAEDDDDEEEANELFMGYATVTTEEIEVLAKDRLAEPRAWYSDDE